MTLALALLPRIGALRLYLHGVPASDRHDAPRPLRPLSAVAQFLSAVEPLGVEDQGAGRKIAESSEHGAEATAQAFSAQQPDDGTEPPGWLDCDDYEIDALDSRPDAETDAAARARIEAHAPRACGRCCGSSSELDPARPGEFRICRACGGSGVEGADPQDSGLCPECEQPAVLGRYSDACGTCMDRLVAAIAADEADAPEDDPDPGDGGLGMPAKTYRAPVPAEAVLLFGAFLASGPTCPGCGRGVGHLYAGAECSSCLLGRAA